MDSFPAKPLHFPTIRYDRIAECLRSGPTKNRDERSRLVEAFLLALPPDTTELDWRTELVSLCRDKAARNCGDDVELKPNERLGWVRGFRKVVETMSMGAAPSVYDVDEIEHMLRGLSANSLDEREKTQILVSFSSKSITTGIMVKINIYPCWLVRRSEDARDLFSDIDDRECLLTWLALPVVSHVGEWIAVNVKSEDLPTAPVIPTFLDGMSIPDDVWIPGGWTASAIRAENKCYDLRFAKGFEECIVHDQVPFVAVDHLTIKLFEVKA